MTTTRTRSLLVSLALAAGLVASGCSGGGSGGGSDHSTGSEPASVTGDVGDDRAAPEAATGSAQQVGNRVDPREPAIISTGTVSLAAGDVTAARTDVQEIVDRAGGTVTEQETTTDDDGALRHARMVVRVPSETFPEAVDALEKVATLTGSTTDSDDVATEVLDVDARIRSQEKSVRRIEALLARAATLSEIITIEGDLAERQAELDSLKSRQKWLADQTSLSTITVHLDRTDATEDDEESGDGFLGGLSAGWSSFLDGLVGTLTVAGFLLPWALALSVILVPAWLWVRAGRGRRTTKAAAGPQ